MDLPLPQNNQFLFLDMNSFFASCEQHRNPSLRGKPVVVTPTLAPTGSVIAASYEAKKLGVTTFCRISEAQTKIPNLTILESDHIYYAAIHKQIAHFLEQSIAPYPIKLSIDEFAIPLTPFEQWTPNSHRLAISLKQQLQALFSPALRCSIGIGPNLFLSKLGTEIQKPNGLVTIQLHTLAQTYAELQLRDISGINWGMSNQLNGLGIRTPLDFYNTPRERLHAAFGITGDAWWYNLHGYQVRYATNPQKSISHSHVLAPELRTKLKARAVLYKLCLKVAERLRDKKLTTTKIDIVIKCLPRTYWRYSLTIRPTQDIFSLFRAISTAYSKEVPKDAQPLKVYIVVHNLAPCNNQSLGLFTDETIKSEALFKSVDTMNAAFGRWTIQPASLLAIRDSAPNRITFRTPDYDMD